MRVSYVGSIRSIVALSPTGAIGYGLTVSRAMFAAAMGGTRWASA